MYLLKIEYIINDSDWKKDRKKIKNQKFNWK
jgi:hypothetical protein